LTRDLVSPSRLVRPSQTTRMKQPTTRPMIAASRNIFTNNSVRLPPISVNDVPVD